MTAPYPDHPPAWPPPTAPSATAYGQPPPPPPPGAPSPVPPAVRWGLGDVGWGLLLYLVGQVAMTFLAVAIYVAIEGSAGSDSISNGNIPPVVVVLGLLGGWLGFVGWPVVCTLRKGQRSLVRDFGLTVNWVDVGWGLAVGIGCLAVSIMLALLWHAISGGDAPSNGQFLNDAKGPWLFLVLFAFVGVFTPIAEELFFRGLVFRSLGKRFNLRWAVIGSSLLFGSLHFLTGDSLTGGLFIVGVTTIYGLAFGLLTAWRNGRIGASIVAHMVINGLQVIAVFALP